LNFLIKILFYFSGLFNFHPFFSIFILETETQALNDSTILEESLTPNDSFLHISPSPLQRKTLMPTIESFSYLKTEFQDKNIEVIDILDKNIKEIKTFLHIFLDSIFSTIYNIPLIIRLFLKLLEKRLLEKFQISEEEIYCVFSNFLFFKWIIPRFSKPKFNSLCFDGEFVNQQTKNMMLLAGILHKIVKMNTYENSASEFLCFNEFIEENK